MMEDSQFPVIVKEEESTDESEVEVEFDFNLQPSEDDSSEQSEVDEEEEEEPLIEKKIFVKIDPCLVCGKDAVMYDEGGKVINSERYFEGMETKFSRVHLFSSLCEGLGLKAYGKLKDEWDFEENFRFCEDCEKLMSSLAEVYKKVEELKRTLKDRMVNAEEEVYVREQLYSKSDRSYFAFRQLVLLDKFKGDVQKVGESNPMDLPTSVEQSLTDEEDKTVKNPSKTIYVMVPSQSRKRKRQEEPTAPTSSSSSSLPPPRMKSKRQQSKVAESDNILSPGVELKRYDCVTMEKDRETGTIKFTTGIGNLSGGSLRSTLTFSPTSASQSYECSDCAELTPLSLQTRKQKSLFCQHFIKFHTDMYKCKVCPGWNTPMNRSELLSHLQSEHNMGSKEYTKVCARVYGRKSAAKKRPKPECEICRAPFKTLSSKEYTSHRMSHLSESDKLYIAKNHIKHAKPWEIASGMPSEKDISTGVFKQCSTCAKFVKDLVAHERVHDKSVICEICGKKFATSYDLGKHIKNSHPNGKMESPQCQYPSCSSTSFDDNASLFAHVQREHGSSEELKKRKMCIHCGKVGKFSYNIRRHMEVMHGGKKSLTTAEKCVKAI